jgi:hypothetical protein
MKEIKVGQLREWKRSSKLKHAAERFMVLGVRPALMEDAPLFYTPDPEEGKIYNEVAVYFVGTTSNNSILKFSEEFVLENSELVEEDEQSGTGTAETVD